MNPYSLEGKVALITGSGRGIGAAMARIFADAGAAVALTARTTSEIEAVAGEITAAGGRATAITTDLNEVAQLPGLVERTVAELGGLDVLINNAGGGISPTFIDTRIEHLESIFHLNVAVPFELSRLALPHLLERPGASIINMSSSGEHKAPRGYLAYYVSKAALAHLTRLMAADLGPRVRVNALVPGPVETEALNRVFEHHAPSLRQVLVQQTRMRRLATPEEIAYAARYLASPAAAWVTGTLLTINGGEVDEIVPMAPDL